VPKPKTKELPVPEQDKPQISEELVDQLLSSVKHPSELLSSDGLLRQLMSRLVQKSLDAELTEHLGYEPGQKRASTNARNGRSPKTLQTEVGPIEVEVPRDREGSFEPQLVPKHQRRLSGFDERILALYACGMSTRPIQDFFQQAYGADVSPQLVSRVTDAALADVEEWRHRKLDSVYPIVYLDGLQVKVKTDGLVAGRVVYVALGVTMEGKKEVLGLWMAQTEGAKFWLSVVTELHNRGVQDILIACCDGLKGFPEAIEAVFPHTLVQTCIVHQICKREPTLAPAPSPFPSPACPEPASDAPRQLPSPKCRRIPTRRLPSGQISLIRSPSSSSTPPNSASSLFYRHLRHPGAPPSLPHEPVPQTLPAHPLLPDPPPDSLSRPFPDLYSPDPPKTPLPSPRAPRSPGSPALRLAPRSPRRTR
jgi:hypothetical protein